jgi:hypothetical protein
MANLGVSGVDEFTVLLLALLSRAEQVKRLNAVEPSLNRSDLRDLFQQVEEVFYPLGLTTEQRKRIHAVIETAVREVFNSILVRIL